ncbi:hypothetical protein E2562_025473 [Oryza meyeriana var. granulata]|uniref:Uncharacterized protein n=1 Tax=Oryza meyeriana var. granulata TaxID=110450 RepID=A0A6G1CIQ8_9ORYZ|nr:hypothetical protein E2562_025473 [Oryza meyeriana var. granulata]
MYDDGKVWKDNCEFLDCTTYGVAVEPAKGGGNCYGSKRYRLLRGAIFGELAMGRLDDLDLEGASFEEEDELREERKLSPAAIGVACDDWEELVYLLACAWAASGGASRERKEGDLGLVVACLGLEAQA